MKKTPVIKDDDIFIIKKKHSWPEGVSEAQQIAVKDYWMKTRGVDLDKPQYEIYSKSQQEKERKQKLSLDRRAIITTNQEDAYQVARKLRREGYDDDIHTGNWQSILDREKELKNKGYKTKVTMRNGWYAIWLK